MNNADNVFKIFTPDENTCLVVINIKDNENMLPDFFEKMPNSDKKDYEFLHHQTKKQEFLAGRLALAKALKALKYEYKGIKKDENGKPSLIDCQFNNKESENMNVHISLSHSYPFACALVCISTYTKPSDACGVDIEQVKDKILRVAPRVFSEKELIFLEKDLKKNTVFWCVKEVLYKIYGKGEVNFKENLFVYPFVYNFEKIEENNRENEVFFSVLAEIKMLDFQQKYSLNVVFLGDFVLCYGIDFLPKAGFLGL